MKKIVNRDQFANNEPPERERKKGGNNYSTRWYTPLLPHLQGHFWAKEI